MLQEVIRRRSSGGIEGKTKFDKVDTELRHLARFRKWWVLRCNSDMEHDGPDQWTRTRMSEHRLAFARHEELTIRYRGCSMAYDR